MKLRQLLELDFMREFESLLETDFERKLFVASLRNYVAYGNPIRFHNFAFSMRELVLKVIARKAPIKQVKKAIWYEKESEDHPVTRRQQLKFCAQKNLSDAYLQSSLDIINETIADFIIEFREFSNYTHISEKTFDVCAEDFFRWVESVMQISITSLKQLEDLEQIVIESIEDKAHKAVVSTAVATIPDCLSALANHVHIDFTEVDEIECLSIDDEFICMRAIGSVFVVQEYGPKNDLCTIEESYPFTLDMKSHVSDPNIFKVEEDELDIDISSWYEDE